MPVIYTKDVSTGDERRVDITDAEAVALGIQQSQSQIDAEKDAEADALLESRRETRALALALVDMIYALRDGQLDAVSKAQARQLLKQRVRANL